MRTAKDVEAYLEKLNRPMSPVEGNPGTFLIHGAGGMPAIAVRVDAPLVVFRVYVGNLAEGAPGSLRKGSAEAPRAGANDHARLFRKLLELNARALVHSSYGLEGDRVVLSSALELENLDFNEVEATLDEMDLALAEQLPELVELAKANG